MDKVVYSCNEHIEELLEVFLDEIEEMPVMEEITVGNMICYECKKVASYRLSGSKVKATWE